MDTLVATKATPPRVRLGALWRQFRAALTANVNVSIGLGIVLCFVLIAIFGPLLVHGDPNAFSSDIYQGPSLAHPFGTTAYGQDVLAQVIIGTRPSVVLGFVAGLISTIISVIVGLVSGYFGGWIDEVLSLITNIFLILPGLPLTIVLAAFIPYKGPLTLGIVIVVTGWSWGARVLRAQTLSMRNREFVTAAKSIGEPSWRIIFLEILPNEIAVVAAELLSTIIYAILAEAGLEYLGLSDLSNISWGTMLYWAENNDALVQGAWWWLVPPGLCIAILGGALAFINFGIDEIANPKLRSERRRKVRLVATGSEAQA